MSLFLEDLLRDPSSTVPGILNRMTPRGPITKHNRFDEEAPVSVNILLASTES